MYKKILIPLDNSPADNTILAHIRPFLKLTGAKIILVHVSDGFGARLQEELNLEDSEEIKADRNYLKQRETEFAREGFQVKAFLTGGEPSVEILKITKDEACDLIAMATHGHRLPKDIILGSVADKIRHSTDIPILMIRAPHK